MGVAVVLTSGVPFVAEVCWVRTDELSTVANVHLGSCSGACNRLVVADLNLDAVADALG